MRGITTIRSIGTVPVRSFLREEVLTGAVQEPESVDWAVFVSLEDAGAGLLCLKESQKCVNQSGVDTGAFAVSTAGVRNTGSGLAPELLGCIEISMVLGVLGSGA